MRKGKIDVLFINPRDLAAPAPYLKLIQLAAVVEKSGFISEVIEPAASNSSIEDISLRIKKQKPSIICVAAFPSTLPDAYKTVRGIRRQFAGIPLVIEGYHVNADPNIVLELGVNYGIYGDTEYCFLELCKCLINGALPPEDLKGLIINNNGYLIVNPPDFIPDINDLPMPCYDKLPIGKYYSASTNKIFMSIFTTRGCPYDCNFCASASQMKFRYLTEENVIRHIRFLVEDLGVEWLEFMDLTFTINRKRIISICETIVKNGVKFDWGCETRADLIDEELLLFMKRAGCKKITFGVESGVERIRYSTGKKISNSKFKEVFELCELHGIKTMANFIFGHHNETIAEMKETIRFASLLRPFNILFTRMVPLPDVEIYKEGVKKNKIDRNLWYQYMRGEIPFPIYYPDTVKKTEMDAVYRLAFLSFYFRGRTIMNYLPLFKDLNFFVKSISIFFRLAFGKTIYK